MAGAGGKGFLDRTWAATFDVTRSGNSTSDIDVTENKFLKSKREAVQHRLLFFSLLITLLLIILLASIFNLHIK